MTKNKKRVLIITLASLLTIVVAFYAYTMDYYRALPEAREIISQEKNVNIYHEDDFHVFSPHEKTSTGIIFYPGGKVEALAYAPIMEELSQKGYTTVLLEMPFNLAVFNINGADEIIEKYSDIDNWYIAGHSLGGAMASSYAGKNKDMLQGVILLGAYPAADLTNSDLSLLVLYGSEDNVLNRETLEKNKGYNPEDALYIELPGGNHAYFGDYGEQEGDGRASLTPKEQRTFTIEQIDEFISAR